MADKPASEKTEQPTARRLRKAREKGQVPQSQELVSAASLSSLAIIIALLAPRLLQWFSLQIRQCFSCQTMMFTDTGSLTNFANTKLFETLIILSPIFAVLSVSSIAATVAISGFNFNQNGLNPKFDALNPTKNFEKLFQAQAVVKLLLSFVKLVFVGFTLWIYLKSKIDYMATLRWAWTMQILVAISQMVMGLLIRVCLALFVIAIAEAAWQKFKYRKDLKMTKQEVKEEHKQAEGSPQVKSKLRSMQYQTALKRAIKEVPKASVILVNPTHYAVAIQYDPKSMSSPKLLAKGADHLAEKIREIARAHGIPIIRRPELTRTIFGTVKEGQFIPENLYVAVAEVLALIYRLRHTRA